MLEHRQSFAAQVVEDSKPHQDAHDHQEAGLALEEAKGGPGVVDEGQVEQGDKGLGHARGEVGYRPDFEHLVEAEQKGDEDEGHGASLRGYAA